MIFRGIASYLGEVIELANILDIQLDEAYFENEHTVDDWNEDDSFEVLESGECVELENDSETPDNLNANQDEIIANTDGLTQRGEKRKGEVTKKSESQTKPS